MQIYFLRHGPALGRDEWDAADVLRPLSTHGEVVVRDVARRIASLHLGLEVILTSPFERALRTAIMVRDTLEDAPPLTEEPRLTPNRFTTDSLAEILESFTDSAAVMLVGHEPSMTEAISGMIGGGRFALRKGGLARIDVDPSTPTVGVLKWFAPPRLLRSE